MLGRALLFDENCGLVLGRVVQSVLDIFHPIKAVTCRRLSEPEPQLDPFTNTWDKFGFIIVLVADRVDDP